MLKEKWISLCFPAQNTDTIQNPSKYLEIALFGMMNTSKYQDVLKDSIAGIIRFELTEEPFQPARKHYTS